MDSLQSNKRTYFALIIAVLVFVPILTLAATMQAGEEVTVSGSADPDGNLYVAGGMVTINTAVEGDLYIAGGTVLVTENVSQDLVVAGGSITALGNSGGDLRVVGGDVLVAGTVGGELIAVGGIVTVTPDVAVGGDVVIAGGQVSLDGIISGDVEIFSGIATLHGQVGGDVIAKIEETFTIADGAVINGNLVYQAAAADALVLGDGAVVTGRVVFEEIAATEIGINENNTVAIAGGIVFGQLVVAIITALILTLLFKNTSVKIVQSVVQNPLRLLGYGVVSLVVLPVVAILLLVTVVGAPLGLMLLLVYGLLLLVAVFYASVVTGGWLGHTIGWTNQSLVTWKHVLGGAVVLTLISLVPIVGWIVGLGVFLITLGSIVDLLITQYKQN